MKKDIFRIKQVMLRDKMMDISALPDVITAEVSEKLSYFLNVTDCVSRIKVEEDGRLSITISLSADGVKPF